MPQLSHILPELGTGDEAGRGLLRLSPSSQLTTTIGAFTQGKALEGARGLLLCDCENFAKVLRVIKPPFINECVVINKYKVKRPWAHGAATPMRPLLLTGPRNIFCKVTQYNNYSNFAEQNFLGAMQFQN